jgi:hypothetical protein
LTHVPEPKRDKAIHEQLDNMTNNNDLQELNQSIWTNLQELNQSIWTKLQELSKSNLTKDNELRELRQSNLTKDSELQELRQSNLTKDSELQELLQIYMKRISGLHSLTDEFAMNVLKTLKRKRDPTPTMTSGAAGVPHKVACTNKIGGEKAFLSSPRFGSDSVQIMGDTGVSSSGSKKTNGATGGGGFGSSSGSDKTNGATGGGAVGSPGGPEGRVQSSFSRGSNFGI